jgi:hypothetical protein
VAAPVLNMSSPDTPLPSSRDRHDHYITLRPANPLESPTGSIRIYLALPKLRLLMKAKKWSGLFKPTGRLELKLQAR